MNILIRNAEIKDLKKVQDLNLKLFEKEHKEYDSHLNMNWTFSQEGTDYFKNKIIKDDGCILICEADNQIVGYLCGGLKKVETYRNLPIVAEIDNTLVLEEFRSKGIGTKLYDEFIKWCKNKNVGKIRVNASAQNKLGINFYRKNRFKDYALILEVDLNS